MSASPAPANADFADRLQRIRDSQGQGILMVGQSEQHVLPRRQVVQISRWQDMAQNFRHAASGFAIVAAGAVGLIIYTQSADSQAEAAATCPPAPVEAAVVAAAKPSLPQFGTHKTTGRKVLHPVVAAAVAAGC